MREVYPEVKKIMKDAIDEAKSFDDVKIRPEHIILAILVDDNNECNIIFKTLKVDNLVLYDKIAEFLRQNDLTPRVGGKKTLPFSDETKQIIKGIDLECDKLNNTSVSSKHIMLSILSTNLPINSVLSEHAVTYNTFKKMIINMSDEQVNNSFESDQVDDSGPLKNKKPIDNKSKTPVLNNFCRDISKSVERGEIDPVVGRSEEIKTITQILSCRKKNNPVLIGEPGVGKCVTSDTEVVMRNDITGEVFKTTINNLLNTITNN